MSDAAKPQDAKTGPRTYVLGGRKAEDVLKGADPTAVRSNAAEYEDAFKDVYDSGIQTKSGNVTIIRPPYNFQHLAFIAATSSVIPPCVEAMVNNVDGTGYEIEAPDGKADDSADGKAGIQQGKDFFEECWPGVSFMTERKAMRRDQQTIGNGYLEMIPNAADQLTFTRRVDATMIRLCRLEDPVVADYKIRRGGKDVTIKVEYRYRRYVQCVGTMKYIFFKEFGCPFDLDKDTGKWATPGSRLPAAQRATSLIHFPALPDASTPYGVPPWVYATPSALGARKAEEFNLEFFDTGGIPPVMIFINGAKMSGDTPSKVQQMLEDKGAAKSRGLVVELEGGESIGDNSRTGGKSAVQVERFGADRQKDSMFEGYMKSSEVKVRGQWRLPPIFVGAANDYSFASAFASYVVGEAQVFRPERQFFDEVISKKVLPALNLRGYFYRSLPLTVNDIANQLEGLTLIKGMIDSKEFVAKVNELIGLDIDPEAVKEEPTIDGSQTPGTIIGEGGSTAAPGASTPTAAPTPSAKSDIDYAVALADAVADGIEGGKSKDALTECLAGLYRLRGAGAVDTFKTALAKRLVGSDLLAGDDMKAAVTVALLTTLERLAKPNVEAG